MKEAQDLHQRAMEAAEAGDVALRAGDVSRAEHLFFDAFRLEREAARKVSLDLEPSRSILFRSAASLALQCGLAAEALQLVREARAGSPPERIAEELQEVAGRAMATLGTQFQVAS